MNDTSDNGRPRRFRPTPVRTRRSPAAREWTFLSNHAHVLVCIALDPTCRLRDVAERVGITERAVQNIVSDLESAGVLSRQRSGRRNTYCLDASLPLRHPLEAHRSVGALLGMVLDKGALRRLMPGYGPKVR